MGIFLDMAIGEIMDKLKEKGMYKNSVIAMSADNGPQILQLCGNPGGHIVAGSAYPFRGGKYTLFQGGVKTLGLISGGAIDPKFKGMKSPKIIAAVDWLPTLLHFTSFYDANNEQTLPLNDNMDGIDLYDEIFDVEQKQNLKEKETTTMSMSKHRKYLILSMEYENDKYLNTGIIYKNHKLLINNNLTWFDGNSCNVRSVNPRSKDSEFTTMIINDGKNVPDLMLFDLERDPNEFNDLLNGEGSKNQILNDDQSEIKKLVVAMHKMLNFERKNKIPDIKTQSFEEYNDDVLVDSHLMDGVHRPFQSEEEAEFPPEYNY